MGYILCGDEDIRQVVQENKLFGVYIYIDFQTRF